MVSSAPWALLVIDMQNDFVRSDSVLCVRGAEATLPRIRRACRWFRARGWPVIWVVREHAADGSDIEAMRLELFRQTPVLVPGTPGCEIVSGLEPEPGEPRIVKKRWSAFLQTELDWVLRRRRLERIAVSGTQIPNCLRATVFDAVCYGYHCVLLSDASSAQDEEVKQANLKDIRNIGVACPTVEEFVAGFQD